MPVLDVKESTALAKHLALIRPFNTQSLLEMNLANPRPQQLQGYIINRTGSHMPLSDATAQISIPPPGFVIACVLCYGGRQERGNNLQASITERI